MAVECGRRPLSRPKRNEERAPSPMPRISGAYMGPTRRLCALRDQVQQSNSGSGPPTGNKAFVPCLHQLTQFRASPPCYTTCSFVPVGRQWRSSISRPLNLEAEVDVPSVSAPALLRLQHTSRGGKDKRAPGGPNPCDHASSKFSRHDALNDRSLRHAAHPG